MATSVLILVKSSFFGKPFSIELLNQRATLFRLSTLRDAIASPTALLGLVHRFFLKTTYDADEARTKCVKLKK